MQLKLEMFNEADFDQLIGWIDSPQLMQEWSGGLFRFPLNKHSLQWYISDTNQEGKSAAYIFKIVLPESGECIGHASLGNISYKNEKARITRVFIAPAYQGRGFAAVLSGC